MKQIKLYKHMMITNIFGLREKIKEQRKSNKYGNKNRKVKN